ncbi:aldehyde reductase [Clonorchis sinensis]|uniref:Aldehyde reductase n=1 Tax=Clonorchis sinensis TaxID=79923 RepID=G7YSB2_CLOSI|nr:aldehyde reductase [Clonorchis sinensis]
MKTVIFSALEAGYRHIDAAFLYGNEKDIGEALEESMKKLNIQREDIFITTKVISVFLCLRIIFPLDELKHSDVNFPKASNGQDFLVDDVPLLDTWKAMESLVDEGMVKAIGLSNFNRRQIDTIMNGACIKLVNLQIEINANFPNTKLVKYAQASGLTVTAYAPLGSPSAAVWQDLIQGDKTNLLTASWVREIAERHNKTSAQILLRYLLQRNIIVIPKSSNPKRIVENSKIFDFTLTDDEMQVLNTSGLNERQFKFPGLGPSVSIPALVLPSGGMAARHRKGDCRSIHNPAHGKSTSDTRGESSIEAP